MDSSLIIHHPIVITEDLRWQRRSGRSRARPLRLITTTPFWGKGRSHLSRWSFLDLINSTKRRQKERNKRKNFLDHSFHHSPELCFFFFFVFFCFHSSRMRCRRRRSGSEGVARRVATHYRIVAVCWCCPFVTMWSCFALLWLMLCDFTSLNRYSFPHHYKTR